LKNLTGNRKKIFKASVAVFLVSLLVVMRSLVYHDISNIAAIISLVLLLASFTAGFVSLSESIHQTGSAKQVFAKKPESDPSGEATLQSELHLQNPSAAIQHFLHLIDPEKGLKQKFEGALAFIAEVIQNQTFLYFAMNDNQPDFIAGTRSGAGRIIRRILPGDSLAEEIREKIIGFTDSKSLRRNSIHIGLHAFPVGDAADERGLLIPVAFFNQLHGVLALICDHKSQINAETRQLLTETARGLAIMLENDELFYSNTQLKQQQAEYQLAKTIFSDLLPDSAPAIRGWKIAQSARYSTEHSGDFHLYLNMPGNRMMILIGKCSGHGLKAAMFLCRLHTMLSCFSESCNSPAEILNRLSGIMNSDQMHDLFATAAAVLLKAGDRSVSVALAGHAVPLVNRSRSGYVEIPQLDPGVPLGLFNKGVEPYKNQNIQLLPGDGILLYTEGVTEFPSDGRERISLEELRQMLDRLPEQSAAAMLDSLGRQLKPGNHGQPPVEDHTLIYAKSE